MDIKFSSWLIEQMQLKNWSQSDLARASGLTRQTISYYLSDKSTKPDEAALTKIAHAFKMSPIAVFRKAGLLPEGGDQASFEDWQHLINQLMPDEREEMREIMQMKIERRQKADKSARATNFKSGKIKK
jgi:transcriptional regulator with XRE-family HTH domain